MAKETAPDGEITTWNRDAEKRVKTIAHNDKDGTSTETLTYDANNDVTADVIARGSDIGKASYYAYDGLGRVYQVKGSNGQISTYAYDGNGSVLSITDALGHQTTYAYDALNRLEGTMDAAGGVTSYTHDAGDHVTRVTDPRGLVQATSFVYSAGSNRLVSTSGGAGIATAYGYNAEGDMETIDGRSAFVHDAFERLFSASGTDFVTSADGQRLEKTSASGTTYFAPDASGALWADDQDGTWKDYVWLNGRMVAMITNGGVYSMHDDQAGRTLAITDPNSHAIDWEAEGLPFDRNTISGSPAFFRPGLPGQYWDAEDGLWHNGARDYNPWLGRYIESDPIGLAGEVNTYAYVGNNPISNVDALGLYASCSCKNGVEHVNIPITFTGKGATPANIQKFTNAIEQEWSTTGFVVSVTSGPQNQILITLAAMALRKRTLAHGVIAMLQALGVGEILGQWPRTRLHT